MINTSRIGLLLALEVLCVTAGQKNGSVPVRGPCGLPLDEGICTAICPRWYYDASVGCCLPFTYGCCCGNDNNFKTRQLCENVCSENNRVCPGTLCLLRPCSTQTCPNFPYAKCFRVCPCKSVWIYNGENVSSRCDN
ncbi:kunitz-type serine protease inhibitor Bt-KTI-like [Crassostrea virginica]